MEPKATRLKGKGKKDERGAQSNVLNVSAELLFAAAGPVVAVESCLDQRRHDAAHTGFIGAAVPLAVVLHSQTTRQNQAVSGGKEGSHRTSVSGHRIFTQFAVADLNQNVCQKRILFFGLI